MVRSLLAITALAILLILVTHAHGADDIVDKPTLSGTNTTRLDFTPVNLGFGNVSVGRRRAPTLTPSPSSLNFGNVQIGNGQQLSETVTNAGEVNIRISQATVAGTGFSMTPWAPVVLTPGQHYTFTVTFAPPSTGNFSGVFRLSRTRQTRICPYRSAVQARLCPRDSCPCLPQPWPLAM